MNQSPHPGADGFGDWLNRFEQGDPSAAEEVVDVFYERLVRLARQRLAGMPPQVADDEGAVVSALRSFFSGIENGQIRSINTENDLWRILATITARKSIRQLRTHWKQSGQGDHVSRSRQVESLLSRDPSPQEEAIMIEEFQSRLAALDDDLLKQIAQYSLEGLGTAEIAERLSIHVRSVQRKIRLIEAKWLERDEP